MSVFLMVRRHKTTIFLDAKENTPVSEIKRMLEGILKVKPTDQRLFNMDNDIMEDNATLQDNGINLMTAKATAPAQITLSLRNEQGEFEEMEVTAYSTPPDIHDVIKNQGNIHCGG